MNSLDERLQGHFDSEPTYRLEYHQDYREDLWSRFAHLEVVLPLLLLSVPLVYQIFFLLDYDLLPIPELLWNCLVYITPSRLLIAIESYVKPLRIQNPTLRHIPRTHAEKSEAMRRLLGLDIPGGILGSVTQASRRRLSSFSGINLVALGADGRPPGLGNWDNSCYQNSVLQGLASLDSLSGYLVNPNVDVEEVEGFSKPDMKMADALRGLIDTLNNPSNNGRRIWTPATLKNMSSWQQQDAQEYFSKVLDEIDKEICKVANIRRKSQGLESEEAVQTVAKNSGIVSISTFRNPLEGLMAQRVGCTKCGYSEGLSMIPFNCLTVPLGRLWEYDVSQCLDEYTKLEHIEGVECGKCTLLKTQRLLSTLIQRISDAPEDDHIRKHATERLKAVNLVLEEEDFDDKTLLQKCKIPTKSRVSSTKSRQAVIARPPKSLVVHFNRSLFDELTGELRKNYSEVRFPKLLDLGPWCLGSSGTTKDVEREEWILNPEQPMIAGTQRTSRLNGPLYELRAVVTHHGRHENGHYICYKKHASQPSDNEKEPINDHWWRLSDDDVMKVSEENVLGQGEVFMLFYDCIQLARHLHQPPLPMEGSCAHEQDSKFDVAIAASVPLPDIEDSDLSESDDRESLLTTREESVATTVSEYGEEESEGTGEQQDYRPTKAIRIAPYIPQTGVHKHGENAGQQGMVSSGCLLMV